MKTIAVEEHFATEEYLEHLDAMLTGRSADRQAIEAEKYLNVEVVWFPGLAPADWREDADSRTYRLLDLGEGRARRMRDEGIDRQVLSLVSPGVQIFDPSTGVALARSVNDSLSRAVKAHPDQFVGLAALAPQSPRQAAEELERAVRQLGLRGAIINSHTRGEYLDDRKYWVIFEAAQALDVPIYLHPRSPCVAMAEPYATYPPLLSAALGFAAETCLHALRLICSGVFDQFPGLKIILGHLGEGLPFWLERIDNRVALFPPEQRPKRNPSEYFRENFYITTSGQFYLTPFLCALLAAGADRILFAVDYPMEEIAEAMRFLETVPLSPADRAKVAHLNAERVFGLGG